MDVLRSASATSKAAASLPEAAYDAVHCIGVYYHLDDRRLKELAEIAMAASHTAIG